MTTNAESSSTTDHLAIHSGVVTDNQTKLESAAFQGALLAFTAPVNRKQPKTPHSSHNGARAAAVSAGEASRQQSVTPPKTSAAASTMLLQPQSSHVSPMQQLVQVFEQPFTGGKLLNPDEARRPSGKPLSESASRVAARIASIGSLSLPRTPSSSLDGGRHDNASSDTLGSEILLRCTKTTQSPSPEPEATASSSPPPVPNSHTLSTVAALKQGHNVGKRSPTASLRKHQQQDAPSMLAAQVAIRNLIPSNPSSVHKPPTSDRKDAVYPNRAALEDLDRGRGSNEHRESVQTKITPSNTLDPSIPKEPNPATDEHYAGEERSGRSVSKHIAYLRTPSTRSKRRVPSRSDPRYVDKITGLTEMSLADAIVASSLASSRTSSPAKTIPPPPPPRRPALSHSLLQRYSSDTDIPRLLATQKGMRDTLRKYPPDDITDANTRRHHKHFMKHPNKHHEGSRQRWKDRVTESERKRYEGVWAANKGNSFTTPLLLAKDEVTYRTSTTELVLDLVVRDVWCRSRLPSGALAEIWNLVDRQGLHALTRDEFVIGLWLIDQSLKGRKLPPRVSPTLWASVSHACVPRRF